MSLENCNLYIDCTNNQISSEQLFKALVKVDGNGCPAVNVVTQGGGGVPAGLATEATLLDVVAGLDSMRDYEVRLVVDSVDVTWLEVRYWDAQDGALGAPIFYPPGSTVAGVPTGAITYINPNTLLTQLLGELTGSVTTNVVVSTAAAGNVPAGYRRGSVLNIGDQPGTWNGVVIPAGVGLPFGGTGKNDTGNAIAYDPTVGGTGTTFLIEYDI